MKKRGFSATAEEEKACKEVIDCFKKSTGKRCRYNGLIAGAISENARYIIQRLREGYTVTHLKRVIWLKIDVEEWSKDDKMRKFVRPETLFKREKFKLYAEEAQTAWEDEYGEEEPDTPALSVISNV